MLENFLHSIHVVRLRDVNVVQKGCTNISIYILIEIFSQFITVTKTQSGLTSAVPSLLTGSRISADCRVRFRINLGPKSLDMFHWSPLSTSIYFYTSSKRSAEKLETYEQSLGIALCKKVSQKYLKGNSCLLKYTF